jgi:hypothetical protein
MKTRDNIMEKPAPNSSGKPISHNMNARYMGCLILEYIPVVIKSPS